MGGGRETRVTVCGRRVMMLGSATRGMSVSARNRKIQSGANGSARMALPGAVKARSRTAAMHKSAIRRCAGVLIWRQNTRNLGWRRDVPVFDDAGFAFVAEEADGGGVEREVAGSEGREADPAGG